MNGLTYNIVYHPDNGGKKGQCTDENEPHQLFSSSRPVEMQSLNLSNKVIAIGAGVVATSALIASLIYHRKVLKYVFSVEISLILR
jgi:hypothetical protein